MDIFLDIKKENYPGKLVNAPLKKFLVKNNSENLCNLREMIFYII